LKKVLDAGKRNQNVFQVSGGFYNSEWLSYIKQETKEWDRLANYIQSMFT
jgi:hypothetical protein